MLLDRPQIVEGSVIVNATVPYGTSDPVNPNVGELFYRSDLGQLRAYGNSGWETISTGSSLGAHTSDTALHLSSFQNTLLDGLNTSLTSSEVNQLVGVTSPIQSQINSVNSSLSTHVSDASVHLTSTQNTFLDGINLPTVTAAHINALPNHLSDYTMHLTSTQNTFLDGITVTATDVNSIPTISSNLSSLTTSFNTHAADASLHLTSAQNTLLDGITVAFADVNRLVGIDTYLTGIGSSSIASSLATLFSSKLDKTGGTMTGNIVMSSGSKITGLPTPTLATDAANKAYVDALAGGIDWKQAVKAATTGPITLSGIQTIDGVSLAANDRVLVKDQADASTNGIYLVASGAWSRATDYDEALEISQSAVYVLAGGSVNGRGSFVQTAIINTFPGDAISFTPFSGPVINSAGNGISLAVGGTVSVKESSGLTFDGSGNLMVDLSATGGLSFTADSQQQLQLTNVGTAGTYRSVTTDAKGRVISGTNPTTLSGYGITDAVLKTGDTMTGTLNLPTDGLTIGSTQFVMSNGNIGVGVTPSAWGASQKAIELQSGQSLMTSGSQFLGLAQNAYFTGTNWIYKNSNYAAVYSLQSGAHAWFNAAVGTAGNTVTFTQSMSLDVNGTLMLGRSSNPSSTRLYVAQSWGEGDPSQTGGEVARFQRNSVAASDAGVAVVAGSAGIANISFGDSVNAGSGSIRYFNNVDAMAFVTNGVERARIDANGNFVTGPTSALTTNATDGFLHISTMAGAPTGTPTLYTGRVPMVFNTASNLLYFYNGSSWVATGASSVPFTSITGLPTRATWNSTTGAYSMTVGQLAWKQFGNNHTIFDASAGTAPDGTAVNNTNATNAWTATSPTLMGWNGSQTYGVRVDSARLADNSSSISSAVGGTYTWTGTNSFKSNSNTGAQGVNTNPTGMRAYSDNNSLGAIMSFQRSTTGVNMGLDSDNVFRIGGWSAPTMMSLTMTGQLSVPSLSTTGSVFNGAFYKNGLNAYLQNADAIAGKRLLLTLPSGAYSGEITVVMNRGVQADASNNQRAQWKFKITRAGAATGTFSYFTVDSVDEDYSLGEYLWYFDSVSGNAYLRFGQTGNSFTWYVETNLAGTIANITPTLVMDNGTVPTGTVVTPQRRISNQQTSNTISFSTAGAERMRIDASGRIGIGFTPLASTGGTGNTLQIGDPSSASGTGITIGSTATGDIQFSRATSGANQYAGLIRYSHTSDFMSFWTSSTERARFDINGNFGINTTTISNRLHIGNIGANPNTSANGITISTVDLGTSTGNAGILLSAPYASGTVNQAFFRVKRGASDVFNGAEIAFNRSFRFLGSLTEDTSEFMRIDSTGSVGIGGAPATKLDVIESTAIDVSVRVCANNATGAAIQQVVAGNGTTSSNYAYTYYQNRKTTSQGWKVGTYGNNNLTIRDETASSNRLIIDTNGNVGISTPSPAYKLDVGGVTRSTQVLETRVAMAANNIDLSAGGYFTKTISAATTLTVSNVPSSGTGVSFILDLTNGGSSAITWWSGVKWAGGTSPTLTASGRDVLGFFTHDGGVTWTGLVLGKDVK